MKNRLIINWSPDNPYVKCKFNFYIYNHQFNKGEEYQIYRVLVSSNIDVKVNNQSYSENAIIVFILNNNDVVTFPGDYNEYFEGVDLIIKQHTRKTKLIDIKSREQGGQFF